MQISIKKNDILKNIFIEKLIFWWKWLATLKHENPDYNWRKLIVIWWVVPESRVNLRVLKKKKSFLETQVVEVVKKSRFEQENIKNPYWECGWCKRINIIYEKQLEMKQEQVEEAIRLLEKYFLKKDKKEVFLSIEKSPIITWYRNKVEFSFWKNISLKNQKQEHFNVWFHKQWEFSKIQDIDWFILIDEKQNEIYREIKKFAKNSWLEVYDQFNWKWFFRHILIRKTYFTNEMMIILSFNPNYFEDKKEISKKNSLERIKKFFLDLALKYKIIKSVYLSHNTNKSDTCIWELELIYWEKTIKEKILWLNFNISPTSFFQTNSSACEKLYSIILDFASSFLAKGEKKIEDINMLDLYAWTWTIAMIFAKKWVKNIVSVELVESASKDWKENAKMNNLNDIKFVNAKVEDFLKVYLKDWEKTDLLVIDPPRAWMHPKALNDIVKFDSKQIIYVSCNPASLARDLEYILKNSNYKVEKIKCLDMFPHTHHIETVVSLVSSSNNYLSISQNPSV